MNTPPRSSKPAGNHEMNHHAERPICAARHSGEPLTIADHGVPVAALTPAEQRRLSAHEQLIRESKVATATVSVTDIPHAPWTLAEIPTEILRKLRGGR